MREHSHFVKGRDNDRQIIEYLSDRFRYLSREEWIQQLQDGYLTCNGSITKPDYIIRTGDKISFTPIGITEPEVNTDIRILYEDDNYLAVNKPPDLPVHPSGRYIQNTLTSLLYDRWPDLRLINRIDRETSGIVLMAKNREAASHANIQMQLKNIHKEYLCLVHAAGAHPEAAYTAQPGHSFTAQGFIYPDPESGIRKKRVFSATRPADNSTTAEQIQNHSYSSKIESCCTEFSCIARNDEYILFHCIPKTGRTHQIRASLYSLGFPVVGDKLYGLDDSLFSRFIQKELTENDIAKLMLSHQALYSWKLAFQLPDGNMLELKADFPEWLDSFNLAIKSRLI